MSLYRHAWTMRLKEGAEADYDAAHADVWPELLASMRQSGVLQFYIYRSGTVIYAFQERNTPFSKGNSHPHDVTKRWWQKMSPLMETDSEGRPVHYPLEEVFAFKPMEK